ncbi:glyoxylase-like metal-dependent hydrolase (beta-lactamase superfamily II) [Hydrogenispora ethanolica]|jgi:glyoxylase-like metal-dependent hydrolase (beta-lactamase superfamily II)|uniref:Glyoxylase-like metal-dependent hydrolase (Beta-lactamase superfamily II) n=1 Tax=Hydrogenispora ethanolica TaxID=1082276 RepID=A0A4R1QRG7_HYDET|nr:MBL fold metallo-hydrolase [Hydrogenispora ethanolica]TCL54955.1 glyoxylase-like metal-dependent hydrolase (beta-lactamase superfamily II) [Hydrogenispora ethanolica]
MNIQRIKRRGVVFTYKNPSTCDLNLYLIRGEKYNYIIDTGLGSLTAEPIKEYIKNDNKPMVVINTHYHWDHIWGNGSFQNCFMIAHQLCRELIRSHWDEMLEQNNHRCCGQVAMNLPNLVFEQGLYFPEDKIRLFHAPGHTADSISVLDKTEKVLIVADNVGENMAEIIPGLDCGKDVYRNTVEKYAAMDFDTCISGHNTILGKDVLETILNKL